MLVKSCYRCSRCFVCGLSLSWSICVKVDIYAKLTVPVLQCVESYRVSEHDIKLLSV